MECKFIQTWEGFVYHMTCRGSRFADGAKRNPDGQVFMKNRETDEWLKQNEKSTREFLRKWGHLCKHDTLMKPIVPPKYDIGFILKNCTLNHLKVLEPWCSTVYTDLEEFVLYEMEEQKRTSFNLSDRIKGYDSEKNNEILIEIDGHTFGNEDFNYIQLMPEILQDSSEIGRFELGNLTIEIIQLNTYENNLIKL